MRRCTVRISTKRRPIYFQIQPVSTPSRIVSPSATSSHTTTSPAARPI